VEYVENFDVLEIVKFVNVASYTILMVCTICGNLKILIIRIRNLNFEVFKNQEMVDDYELNLEVS
jgi:hypothetical protein